MKLAAIYNVWDGEELLEGSIRQIRDHVDVVTVVVQAKSNYGEKYAGGFLHSKRLLQLGLIDDFIHFEFGLDVSPMVAETKKRNDGIYAAFRIGCTHFITMDCDEYYHSDEFARAKDLYIQYEKRGYTGSVCQMQTYFKEPTLKLDPPEDYFVPFIHKLTDKTRCGNFKYPFYCDPTRRVSPVEGVLKLDREIIEMHHYSYVRKDIERKIRNSTARNNIQKTPVLQDYATAKEGKKLKYCDRKLILAGNPFNICL